MKLLKGLLILALPLLLLSNEVIAGSKYVSAIKKKKVAKKKDPNQQALEDLKLLSAKMHKYYNVEDYPAGPENESKKYTSLRDLLADFALTNLQTEMGSDEEQEQAKEKLKKIIISAKKFKAGQNNATIRDLTIMLKNNEKYSIDHALEIFCIKKEDYEHVKESLGVTDADINIYTDTVTTKEQTYELKNLVPKHCYNSY